MTPDAEAIIQGQLTGPLTELRERGDDADRAGDFDALEAVQEDAYSFPLSIELERTVRIVLCTGGPHVEVRVPERGGIDAATAYAVWGTTRRERPLTTDETDAVERFYGADVEYIMDGGAA